MVNIQRLKFPLFALVCQVIFLVLFGMLVDYDDEAKPKSPNNLVPSIVARRYTSKFSKYFI